MRPYGDSTKSFYLNVAALNVKLLTITVGNRFGKTLNLTHLIRVSLAQVGSPSRCVTWVWKWNKLVWFCCVASFFVAQTTERLQ